MPRPVDSGGPPQPCQNGCFVLPSCTLKPSASATSSFRSCTSTSGYAVAPTAYRILCVRLPHLSFAATPLLHEANTRYGRVASPFPTGTFTPQDTPSFAWRDNGAPQARGVAATLWRRLLCNSLTMLFMQSIIRISDSSYPPEDNPPKRHINYNSRISIYRTQPYPGEAKDNCYRT